MSHIVIDAREYTTSTGRYVSRLIQYLQLQDQTKSEHQYFILLYPRDLEACALTAPNFTKVACPHKEFTFDEQLGFLRQLHGLRPDLVHFAAVQQPILYSGAVVTTMHDLTTVRFTNPTKNPVVFKAKQQVYKAVNKIVARKSRIIITPTEFVKQDIVDFTGVSADKIQVTLEAADPIRQPAEAVPELQGQQFIMYVGRPLPHKNLDRLIAAFAALQSDFPNLKLVLAGKTDVLYQNYRQMVQQKGIQNVMFTGFVSEGQLRWLYEHCAAYVFPSLSEGFGLPGLEAMAHGAPVISSNATCLPEVHGEAAAYFDPLSVSDMSDTIASVLKDTNLQQKLRQQGTERVSHFSWARMAAQTQTIYEQALRNQR